LSFQNYVAGWRGFGGITFTIFFGNLLIVTGISTAASVFDASCSALPEQSETPYDIARAAFVCRSFLRNKLGGVSEMGIRGLIPVFAIFILFQRYLVAGISTRGLKG
jgi:hypothetical protein